MANIKPIKVWGADSEEDERETASLIHRLFPGEDIETFAELWPRIEAVGRVLEKQDLAGVLYLWDNHANAGAEVSRSVTVHDCDVAIRRLGELREKLRAKA